MNRPSQICAVIFDMDGVLTDSEPLINAAAIAMFKEQGLIVQPVDFLPFVGAGEDRYIGGVAEKYQFPLDLPGAKRRTYEIYIGLVPTSLRAFPGAQDFVRSCRAAGLLVARTGGQRPRGRGGGRDSPLSPSVRSRRLRSCSMAVSPGSP